MKSHASLPCGIAAALTVLTLATAGLCTETATATTAPDRYGYEFKDDVLQAGGFGPNDARLRVVPHAVRSVLIRPRTQFIAEMLKSVENL
jgi:hypothetical protein